jgi:hypothetical protein
VLWSTCNTLFSSQVVRPDGEEVNSGVARQVLGLGYTLKLVGEVSELALLSRYAYGSDGSVMKPPSLIFSGGLGVSRTMYYY